MAKKPKKPENKLRSAAEIATDLAPLQAGLAEELVKTVRNETLIEDLTHKVTACRQALELAQLQEQADHADLRQDQHNRMEYIDISSIMLQPNHRDGDDDLAIARLAKSIKLEGLHQPIGVREDIADRYVLIYGHRRLKAAQLNGMTAIQAKIYDEDLTDEQIEAIRASENLQRRELSPTEQALAVSQMLHRVDEHADAEPEYAEKVKRHGGREAWVAARLGWPVSRVRDYAFIERLSQHCKQLLRDDRIDLGHARELVKCAPEDQDDLVPDYARTIDGSGGRPVHELAARIRAQQGNLARAPWRLDVKFDQAHGAALETPCIQCQFNSKNTPLLFEHESQARLEQLVSPDAAGICSNAYCFEKRGRIAEQLVQATVTKVAKAVKSDDQPTVAQIAKQHQAEMPAIIKPAVVARAVLKKTQPAKPQPAATGESPNWQTWRAYLAKRESWMKGAHQAITTRLAKTRGASTLFALLLRHSTRNMQHDVYCPPSQDPIEAFSRNHPDDMAKWREARKDFKTIAAPSLAAFGKFDQAEIEENEWSFGDLPNDAIAEIATWLNVKLPAAPGLEDEPAPAAPRAKTRKK